MNDAWFCAMVVADLASAADFLLGANEATDYGQTTILPDAMRETTRRTDGCEAFR